MGGFQPDREAACPPRRPFPRLLAVLVVAVVAVGCTSGNGENSGQDSGQGSGTVYSGQDSGQGSGNVYTFGQDACTEEEYPQPLTVSTDVPEEVPYLEEIVACTDAAQSTTWLANKTETVWTLATTQGGADVNQLSSSLRAVSFREALATKYQYPVLAPESSVVVHAAPSETSWTLHSGYSAMWLAHDELADQVKKYGENQLTDMLSGGSLRRRALITCSLAGWHVAGDKAEKLTGDNPAQQWLAGLGIGAESTQCAKAWLQADDEAASLFPRERTATWRGAIRGLAENGEFLRLADERLTTLNRLAKLVVRATH
jgi:hypothetical protein